MNNKVMVSEFKRQIEQANRLNELDGWMQGSWWLLYVSDSEREELFELYAAKREMLLRPAVVDGD